MTPFFSPSLFFLFSLFLVARGVFNVNDAGELVNLIIEHQGIFDNEIILTADLDFRSVWKSSLPVGMNMGECLSFSGYFDGNNHSIKNLVLKNSAPAGLFCNLVNATISNLVIDSSCSFSGTNAGALSPTASGSVSITNVVNNALVDASKDGGGLVGRIETLSPDSSVVFRKCMNHGNIFGTVYVGGIVGRITPKVGKVVFFDCENNGTVKVYHEDSPNHVSAAGLVATIDKCGSPVVVDGCTNSGNIMVDGLQITWRTAGGLVGHVSFSPGTSSFSISNSINSGNVSGLSAAGLYCSDESVHNHQFIVSNCVNKGNISGKDVYGIASIISEGNIIISLGSIDSTQKNFSICRYGYELSHLYVYEGITAKTEQNVEILVYKGSAWQDCFCTVTGRFCVNDNLNKEAIQKQYGKVWTSLLDLVDAMYVTVGAPVNRPVYVQEGDTFEAVAQYGEFSFDDYYPVDRSNWHIVTNTQHVEAGMDIALCHKVILSGDPPRDWFGEHGQPLSSVPEINRLCLGSDRIVLVDSSDDSVVYGLDHIIERDLNVTAMEMCSVQIGEPINNTFDVFVNASYGSISSLLEYLQNPRFLVFEGDNSSTVLKENTPVLGDSFVTIKKASIVDIILERNETSKSDVLDYMEEYEKDSEFSIGHIEVIDQGNGTFTITISVVEEQVDDLKNSLFGCIDDD